MAVHAAGGAETHGLLEACQEAIKEGNMEAFVALSSREGFDINSAGKNGFNSLHFCACYGQPAIAEYILSQRRAKVDAVTYKCNTTLHIACFEGHHELVKVLIAHNASSQALNNQSKTPLHMAQSPRTLQVLFRALIARSPRGVPHFSDRLWRHYYEALGVPLAASPQHFHASFVSLIGSKHSRDADDALELAEAYLVVANPRNRAVMEHCAATNPPTITLVLPSLDEVRRLASSPAEAPCASPSPRRHAAESPRRLPPPEQQPLLEAPPPPHVPSFAVPPQHQDGPARGHTQWIPADNAARACHPGGGSGVAHALVFSSGSGHSLAHPSNGSNGHSLAHPSNGSNGHALAHPRNGSNGHSLAHPGSNGSGGHAGQQVQQWGGAGGIGSSVPGTRILGGVDKSNRDLGDAACCEEDTILVRDLQLQLHRLTLELADNKLSLEDATLGRSKDQANARRACVEAERLRSEMEEARGLIEGQAALLEQLDHERRKCGDLEGQLTSASGALERERRQRVSDEDQHVQSLRKAEATQASLKAAAEVIRERMDAQSSEVAFLKEQQAHTLSQLQAMHHRLSESERDAVLQRAAATKAGEDADAARGHADAVRGDAERYLAALEIERAASKEAGEKVVSLAGQMADLERKRVMERDEWQRASLAWSNELEGLRGERDALASATESLRCERVALSRDLGEARGRERAAKGRITSLEGSLGTTSRERDDAKGALACSERRSGGLAREVGELKDEAKGLRGQVDEMRRRLEESECAAGEAQSLFMQVSRLRGELTREQEESRRHMESANAWRQVAEEGEAKLLARPPPFRLAAPPAAADAPPRGHDTIYGADAPLRGHGAQPAHAGGGVNEVRSRDAWKLASVVQRGSSPPAASGRGSSPPAGARGRRAVHDDEGLVVVNGRVVAGGQGAGTPPRQQEARHHHQQQQQQQQQQMQQQQQQPKLAPVEAVPAPPHAAGGMSAGRAIEAPSSERAQGAGGMHERAQGAGGMHERAQHVAELYMKVQGLRAQVERRIAPQRPASASPPGTQAAPGSRDSSTRSELSDTATAEIATPQPKGRERTALGEVSGNENIVAGAARIDMQVFSNSNRKTVQKAARDTANFLGTPVRSTTQAQSPGGMYISA